MKKYTGEFPILELREDDYIFDEDTGDLTLPKTWLKDIGYDTKYVAVRFVDEADQQHFPEYQVRRNFNYIRLEYLG